MRILGIDPGSHSTGYGLIDPPDLQSTHCLAYGHIHTTGKEVSQRLLKIYQQLSQLIQTYQPDAKLWNKFLSIAILNPRSK